MQASATVVKAAVLYRVPLPASPRFKVLDLLIKILVPLGLLMSFWAVVQIGSLGGYLRLFSLQNYHKPLVALGAGYSLAFLIFQAVRTYLWWRYKPYPVPPGPLPRVTAIIPAYNEGAMVEKAIYSLAASDYPAGQLEIICIDDGSRDDTWEYMQRAARRFPKLSSPLPLGGSL